MIETEIHGHVAVITINRPEARNAVNGEVAQGIEAAIDRLEEDDDLWVGILTSSGPVFSAGADLKAINAGEAASLVTERGGFAGITARERTKPIIAAVDGAALAGGCELVLACDLVVASTEARFGIPEVKRCLVAAGGGLFRLPQVVPANVAMEMALTGDPIDATRAHHFGFVNRLTEAGKALEGAMALANEIAVNAPIAVRESRRVMVATRPANEELGWKMSMEAMGVAMSSEDMGEGLTAFIEKREPVWKGR